MFWSRREEATGLPSRIQPQEAFMGSRNQEQIARLYTKRHDLREGVYTDKPYANFGYWDRDDMTINEACDALTLRVAGAAGIGPGDRVLEAGCGYGASAVCYTQHCRPASVIGIDVTEIRIQTGREYVTQHGLGETIQLQMADATALPFGAGAFTKILAIECAFHFDTRQDFMREAGRVLAAGGRLAVADIIPRTDTDLEHLAALAPSFSVRANFYDAVTYENYLRQAGFDDVRIEDITERTTTPFTEYVERVGRQTPGMRGVNFLRTANLYRQYRDAGAEYVLVSARRRD
jgi:microcystin synthetase protein McyJ